MRWSKILLPTLKIDDSKQKDASKVDEYKKSLVITPNLFISIVSTRPGL